MQTIRQTLLIGSLLVVVAFTAYFLLNIYRVFLMIFAAIVIAVFLNGCGTWVSRRLKTRHAALGTAIVLLALVTFFGISFWFVAPRVESELASLQISIPSAIAKLTASGAGGFSNLAGSAAGRFQNVLSLSKDAKEWAIDIVVIVFLSAYLAFQPSLYRKGALLLIPLPARVAVHTTIDRLQRILWRWFIGRIIGMITVGTMVSVAMWILGMPLIFALGLIAGVFEFVPYLGAFVSAVPAVLIALSQSTTKAWIVVLAYLVVHGIDGYIVIPLVERRAVRLAPGVTIVVQVAMYIAAGLLGVLIADPLTACFAVLVNRFYVQPQPQD